MSRRILDRESATSIEAGNLISIESNLLSGSSSIKFLRGESPKPSVKEVRFVGSPDPDRSVILLWSKSRENEVRPLNCSSPVRLVTSLKLRYRENEEILARLSSGCHSVRSVILDVLRPSVSEVRLLSCFKPARLVI